MDGQTLTEQDHAFSVRLRGVSPGGLRRRALSECGRVFGDCPWQLTRAEVVPCMVTAGGRVRLYEGNFSACRASEAQPPQFLSG